MAEQRYQAVLAVISDGLSVSQVAEKVGVSRTDPAGPERTIRHRPQFIVRRGYGPGLNSAYSRPLSGSQSAAKRPSNAEGAVCIMLMKEDPTTLN